MELVPAVTAWLDSRMRVLKKNVSDLVTDPIGHVEKQVYNTLSDTATFVDKANEDPMKWVEGLAGNGVVGAFRPVGSKLLPSTLQGIKKGITPVPYEGPRGWDNGGGDNPPLSEIIQGKVSDKALQTYGTEKFPLDPYLAHVRGGKADSAEDIKGFLNARELSLQDMRAEAQYYSERKPIIDRLIANGKRDPSYRSEELRRLEGDLRAYRFALSEKAPIFRVELDAGAADIQEGAYNLGKILGNSQYSDEQLSKKSLEQLVSIGKKTEAAQLKEASVIKDFTVKRSAQLNQEQGLPKGFIELKTQQDLGAETEFMNNCVGAGGAHPRTGKFIPKWHPITGEQITKGFAEDSGDQYWKRLQSGNERIFSYRPEGLPVATIRMDTRTGEVIEALGVENRPIPSDISNHIKLFVDQKKAEFLGFPLAAKYKRIASEDPFAHNVPRAIGQLLRPRRAARELNPPHAQIEWEPDGGLFGDF
jgi:hypothetical protein